MQEHIVAKSIAETFLAAKIIKAIENIITRKESISLIDSDDISLEDYLFEDYNFELTNTNTLNNLIIIDYKGNILNFIGKKFITESEVINFKNKSNTIIRVDYALDINNTKQVTNTVAGIPQITEIVGQLSSNDITIKEGNNSNEIKVYDTKTGNYIASVKLTIPEKLKHLIKIVYERVKKIFSNDMKYKSPAYIIGLIGSFIIAPIYSKVKNLLEPKQENYLYFEDDTNKAIAKIYDSDSNEQKKINGLINKITAFISKFFKNTGKILKAFVQFTIALFKNIKVLAIKTLTIILQLFNEIYYLFIYQLITFIDAHVALFTWPIAKGLKVIGSKTNIQFIIKFAERLDRIATSSLDRIVSATTRYALFKPIANNLKLSFKRIQSDLNKNLEELKKLANKNDPKYSSKKQNIISNIFEKGIIEIAKINAKVIVGGYDYLLKIGDKNISSLKEYLKLCEVINSNINQIAKVLTPELIAEIKKYDEIKNTFNIGLDYIKKYIYDTAKMISSDYKEEIENNSEYRAVIGSILMHLKTIVENLENMRIP